MKFLVLFVGIGAILPLSIWLRSGTAGAQQFWMLFGLLPFLTPAFSPLDIAIVSWWPHWIGLLSGLEVTAVDIFALAAFFILPPGRNPYRFHYSAALYLLAVSLSVTQAEEPVAALFYVWQFCRVYLLLVVVARACSQPDVPVNILLGMAVGLGLEALIVGWQRYGIGMVQTPGTFPHQNTLGMVTHFVTFPFFALLLAGARSRWVVVVPLVGAFVAVMTASRAALGFAAVGFILIYLISTMRQPTLRKGLVGLIGLIVAGVLAPVVVTSFQMRFEQAPLTEHEYDERAAFNRTANLILQDHPFGIGVNHYVYVAKNFGYSERAGVAPVEGSRNNIVHNVFWLVAAETGYFGLAAYVLLVAHVLFAAFSAGWKDRSSMRGDLLLGLGVALCVALGHSSLEYILLSKEPQYMFAIAAGLVFGLAGQVVESRRVARSPIRRLHQPSLGGSHS